MALTVWGSWSLLVQVMVLPALTVTVVGENAKFWIAMLLVWFPLIAGLTSR
jgi:hypothetical protein